jgi:ribosomal protein S27AE
MPDFIAKSPPGPVIRPSCPNCGTQMLLARITPESIIPDRQTFECLKCNLAESAEN